jgi:hypothetical protein
MSPNWPEEIFNSIPKYSGQHEPEGYEPWAHQMRYLFIEQGLWQFISSPPVMPRPQPFTQISEDEIEVHLRPSVSGLPNEVDLVSAPPSISEPSEGRIMTPIKTRTLTPTISRPPDEIQIDMTYEEDEKKNARAMLLLFAKLENPARQHILFCTRAPETWRLLRTRYADRTDALSRARINRQLELVKYENNAKAEQYCVNVEVLGRRLGRISRVDQKDIARRMLANLPPSFKSFVDAYQHKNPAVLNVDEVRIGILLNARLQKNYPPVKKDGWK